MKYRVQKYKNRGWYVLGIRESAFIMPVWFLQYIAAGPFLTKTQARKRIKKLARWGGR